MSVTIRIDRAVVHLGNWWRRQDKENKLLWIAGGVILCGSLFISLYDSSTGPSRPVGNQEQPFRMDLAIPEGWSLVPLSGVANHESLQAVVGEFALVDVFATDRTGRPSDIALLENARLVRAPRDLRQFAVLVPSQFVARVAKTEQVFVTVKNPQGASTTQPGRRQRNRITIGGVQ